jgi:DNA-binding IclR family transcriptional regulator
MNKASSKKSPVPALTRSLRVLDALVEDPFEMTLAELSEKLHIPSASLWRIMKVLTDHEYVIFDKKRHTYRLGFKLMVMGNILLSGSRFRSQGREYLKKLADATGETAELDVRIRDQLVLIDQVAGPNPVTLYSHVGSAMPYFHATAPGKVYLAHVDREKRSQVMKKIGFPKLTDHTIQSLDRLEQDLEQYRKDGYAVDREEMREGVARIAAPVYNENGRLIACLAVACPAFKLSDENLLETYGSRVKSVALEMSKEGGRI